MHSNKRPHIARDCDFRIYPITLVVHHSKACNTKHLELSVKLLGLHMSRKRRTAVNSITAGNACNYFVQRGGRDS